MAHSENLIDDKINKAPKTNKHIQLVCRQGGTIFDSNVALTKLFPGIPCN